MNENDASIFASKIRLSSLVFGWGMFTIFVLRPFFYIATLYFSNIFILLIPYVALFAFFIIILRWTNSIMKSRFNFWMDVEVLDPLLNVFFPMISGWLISAFLYWWFLMIIGFFSLKMVFTICILAAFFSLYYFVLRYIKRRYKGERYRYIRGKSEEIEETVKRALDSLNFKYMRVIEGSRWTMLIPSYQIEDSEISVKVRKWGRRVVIIVTKVQSTSDIPKVRQIEKSIDSLMDIIKR